MNYTSIKSKNTALVLPSVIFATCLVMPLTVKADTDASVDAIMEQLKSFKAPVPKVPTPPPAPTPIKEDNKRTEPAPIIEKPVEPEPVRIEVAPTSIETRNNTIREEPVSTGIYVSPEDPEPPVKKRRTVHIEKKVRTPPKTVSKKRRTKKVKAKEKAKVRRHVSKRKNKATDYTEFDQKYMELINDILNDRIPAKRATPSATAGKSNFSGLSGWIFLGKFSAGRWKSGKTLKIGNQLPKVGQQYTVKSPLLNMRKTKPHKGLGKLIKVLHVGDQVIIKSLHRSSKNNYWANIVRP